MILAVIHDFPFAAPASHSQTFQWGPRPHSRINDMEDGRLKNALKECVSGPFHKTDCSVGHRGTALKFPARTMEIDKAAGLDITTWTLGRSTMLADGNHGCDCQTIDPAIHREGYTRKVLNLLARNVGINHSFSDPPDARLIHPTN